MSKHISKRYVVLLEVLIAFLLVVLCILPLIYPHVVIYQSEKKFIETVKLDHAANLFYALLLEKLYHNSIPFNDIESKAKHPIDEKMWKEIEIDEGLPFEGTYQFSIAKKRPKEIPKHFLVNIDLSFLPKGAKSQQKPLDYRYQVYIERKLPNEENVKDEAKDKKDT